MKKMTLLIAVLFSISLYAEDIVIQDFESGFVAGWGTNGNIGNSPDENHENFCIVDNPQKDEINSSNKVGKFHRLKSGNWWALSWFEFNEIQIEASLASPKYLHISVYKPVASRVCIQVKNTMHNPQYNTGELLNDKQTKINEWQDLVYKITTSGTFKIMEVKPDFVNSSPADRLDGDIDIYFDNIVINDDPTPLGEEPEPLPEFKGKLPEGFEGENTLIDPVFYNERFGTFGQSSAATDLTVADNPAAVGINTTAKCAKFVRKMNGEWWAGAYMSPLYPMVVDETNKYFHIMVYREIEPTSLSLKLERSAGGDTGDIVLEGDENGIYDWVDYVFEIPVNKYGTYDKIAFMPDFYSAIPPAERFFDNVNIYFDALELNNNPAPRTSGEVSGLFNPKKDNSSDWVRVDNTGNIVVDFPEKDKGYAVQLYNVSGQLINSIKNAHTSVSLPANQLKGIYIVKVTTATGKACNVKVCL